MGRRVVCVLGLGLACVLARAGEDVEPGLIGEYFAIGEELIDFPTLAADRKPNVKKVDRTVSIDTTEEGFNGTDLTEQFFVRWTGLLKITQDGIYKLFIASDDGSRLFLNGKQLIDNGGPHALEERSAEIELKAGVHELRFEMFENNGGAACILSWQPPGGEKKVLPPEALVHRKGADK